MALLHRRRGRRAAALVAALGLGALLLGGFAAREPALRWWRYRELAAFADRDLKKLSAAETARFEGILAVLAPLEWPEARGRGQVPRLFTVMEDEGGDPNGALLLVDEVSSIGAPRDAQLLVFSSRGRLHSQPRLIESYQTINRAVKTRPPWCACDLLSIEVGSCIWFYAMVRGTPRFLRLEYDGKHWPGPGLMNEPGSTSLDRGGLLARLCSRVWAERLSALAGVEPGFQADAPIVAELERLSAADDLWTREAAGAALEASQAAADR